MAAGKFISGYDRELHRLLDGVDSRSMACGFGNHGLRCISKHSGRSMALGKPLAMMLGVLASMLAGWFPPGTWRPHQPPRPLKSRYEGSS